MAEKLVRELFTNTPAADEEGVRVSGWVRTMRESKTFAFIELNDGTYFRNLQLVLDTITEWIEAKTDGEETGS